MDQLIDIRGRLVMAAEKFNCTPPRLINSSGTLSTAKFYDFLKA